LRGNGILSRLSRSVKYYLNNMNKFVLALIAVMMLVSQVACTGESQESHNYIGTPGYGGIYRGRPGYGGIQGSQGEGSEVQGSEVQGSEVQGSVVQDLEDAGTPLAEGALEEGDSVMRKASDLIRADNVSR
jgi:hypothetical protein